MTAYLIPPFAFQPLCMTPKVEEIKDALRNCTKVPEVNSCARHYAQDVAALAGDPDPDLRVMALQIRNLAELKRQEILKREKS